MLTRTSIESSVEDIVQPGEASVWPYTMVISFMCMRSTTSCITLMGQGEPAMMPVRM